ncbi:MAG: cryptochrome/photolyase family protein [Sediminibacterium sp.]
MQKLVSLIFPNQLYQSNPILQKGSKVYLIEEPLFFKQFIFHKQKLILHRASMKFYEQYLISKGFKVEYIHHFETISDVSILIKELVSQGFTHLNMVEVVDDWLLKKVLKSCKRWDVPLQIFDTPYFLNTTKSTDDFFNKRKTYFQTDFYTWQRKQRGILLEKDGKPIGGKWTYDTENRSKFPKNEIVPKLPLSVENEFILEAKQYVSKYFPNNYGNVNGAHLFVTNFEDSALWLDEFLVHKFEKFGTYEDAIVSKESVLYHSVLSPMLNIGLLSPHQVIDKALEIGASKNIPLNSVEGFVRQIMGWREFIKIVYEKEGSKQRTTNYWNFKRKIPASFWSGTTGIVPVDITIQKVLKTGYCHHIERLMVLGNFMLLCEFDPNEVYRWFMEMFIDAYDWVMVPTVYGMTQFADGGLMTTKPYISGSNYLMKMSDYEKGEWQSIWDGLFWRFMHEHRSFFLKNPRLGMLVGTFDKMSAEKKETHLNNANYYLNKLNQEN